MSPKIQLVIQRVWWPFGPDTRGSQLNSKVFLWPCQIWSTVTWSLGLTGKWQRRQHFVACMVTKQKEWDTHIICVWYASQPSCNCMGKSPDRCILKHSRLWWEDVMALHTGCSIDTRPYLDPFVRDKGKSIFFSLKAGAFGHFRVLVWVMWFQFLAVLWDIAVELYLSGDARLGSGGLGWYARQGATPANVLDF